MLINALGIKKVWIGVSEGLDVNKTSTCNRYHDLLMMSINLSDIVILNIKCSDYHCVITLISTKETLKLMQNADSTEKSEKS